MAIKKFFFDVETTGIDHRKNCIWQLAGIMEIDGAIQGEIEMTCQPQYPENINDYALQLSGMTKEEMMNLPPADHAFADLTDFLQRHINPFDKNDKAAIVGYNVAFDENFLREFWKRNNNKYFGGFFWSGRIDVLSMAMDHLLERRPFMANFKLETVAKELGIEAEDWHDARTDIQVTREIYHQIKSKYHF